MDYPTTETAADVVVISLANRTVKVNVSGGQTFALNSVSSGIKPGRWYLSSVNEAFKNGNQTAWFALANDRPARPFSDFHVPSGWHPVGIFQFRVIGSPSGDDAIKYFDETYGNTEYVEVTNAVQHTVLTLLRRLAGPAHHGTPILVDGSNGRSEFDLVGYYFTPPRFVFVY